MLLVEQKSMMNLRKLLPLVILIIKVQSTMFLIFGRVQTISFSLFARFVLLEVAPWRIAKKAPASPIFPNSPWNWAPGILSFLPARPFPPLPWWSLIWGRWQLGRRPTPQEQGWWPNSMTGGVTRGKLILPLANVFRERRSVLIPLFVSDEEYQGSLYSVSLQWLNLRICKKSKSTWIG